MELKQAFGKALKKIRKNRGLTQEDFSQVSSRTYLSTLERGLKSPTLEKIDELAAVMGVHPLTIFASCYLNKEGGVCADELFRYVRAELDSVCAYSGISERES